MKLRNIIKLSLLAILLSGVGFVALVVWSVYEDHEARIGPERVFSLDHQPEFLTEALALDIAQKTLEMSKYKDMRWEPRKDGMSKAPDGRVDEYVNRTGLDPNHITMVFCSDEFKLFVHMEFKGDQVVSHTVFGK